MVVVSSSETGYSRVKSLGGFRWLERIEEGQEEGRQEVSAGFSMGKTLGLETNGGKAGGRGKGKGEENLEDKTDTARTKTMLMTRRHGGLGWAGDPCGMSQVASAQTG